MGTRNVEVEDLIEELLNVEAIEDEVLSQLLDLTEAIV